MAEKQTRKEFLAQPAIISEINKLVRAHSRSDLINMCTQKKINSTGTKHDMATRVVLTSHDMLESRENVVEKLRRQRQEIRLVQLNDGNYLYAEPNLVFHHITRRVFCRHEGDATDGVPKKYETLRESDIEYCKQWKLPYQIPEQPVADMSDIVEDASVGKQNSVDDDNDDDRHDDDDSDSDDDCQDD